MNDYYKRRLLKKLHIVKKASLIFLGIGAVAVVITALVALTVSCIMFGGTFVSWFWKALGN